MEVAAPKSPPSMDFERPSPRFRRSPPSPGRCGDHCLSAPGSPRRMSEFYRHIREELDELSNRGGERAATPGSPDFAFDLDRDLEKSSLSAAELFDGGKIRSLKPPPLPPFNSDACSPRRDRNPDRVRVEAEDERNRSEQERGRGRAPAAMSSSRSGHRATRSLSPFRAPDRHWDDEEDEEEELAKKNASQSSQKPSAFSKSSKLWRFTDFLLFRSASEGRARYEDGRPKRASPWKKTAEEAKNRSFRAAERPGSAAKGTRRKAQASPHELHYAAHRAVAEDMKKKTFLPYKNNIFGFGPFSRK